MKHQSNGLFVDIDVSIIIPTFNRPETLIETLGSVLRQSNCSLEVIVVDDSGTRSAEPVVQRVADHRVRYIDNPDPSRGFPSRVRNLGLTHASGRIVHFLDDDDHVPDDLYRDTLLAFSAHPDVGVVFGRVEPFGDNIDKLKHERAFFAGAARASARLQWFGRHWPISTRMIFYSTVLVCGAALIRRECVAGCGGFDPNIRYGEDADFYSRAIRKYGGVFVDRAFLDYRIWDSSIAHAPGIDPGVFHRDFKKMQTRFRQEQGLFDYAVSKVAAKTVFRVI